MKEQYASLIADDLQFGLRKTLLLLFVPNF